MLRIYTGAPNITGSFSNDGAILFNGYCEGAFIGENYNQNYTNTNGIANLRNKYWRFNASAISEQYQNYLTEIRVKSTISIGCIKLF